MAPKAEHQLFRAMKKLVNSLVENPLKEVLVDEDTTTFVRKILLDGLGTNLGNLSLTEKPDNLLMWSHYAQQHMGFVIEFDSSNCSLMAIIGSFLLTRTLIGT